MIDLMQTLGYSIDRYIGEGARRGLAPMTLKRYRDILNELADRFPREWGIDDVTTDQVREFLDRRQHLSKATQAAYVTALNGFFTYAYEEGLIRKSPMERIRRPRRERPEDLDVVAITTADVRRLLDAAHSWPERLCIATLAYLGPRRDALSRVRLGDVDFDDGVVKFHEKGGKVISKPIPDELLTLYRSAKAAGVWDCPDSYLIPNRGAWPTRRKGERSNRIIYDLVRDVAARAGVRTHVHALRAAFAVYYLETHERDIEALKELMGHARYETTGVYLRKLDKRQSMERVRDLNWNVSFADNVVVPPAGFEPAFSETHLVEPVVGSAEVFTPFGFDLSGSLSRVLRTVRDGALLERAVQGEREPA